MKLEDVEPLTTLNTSRDERISVGVADLKVATGSGTLVTHALGSCIGVSVFDPVARVGGMLHFMLQEPSSAEQKAKKPAAMFATTGIPALFREAYALGAKKERMVVCAAGGASLLNDSDRYQIGKRNKVIMRKIFWRNGITLAAEDIGGHSARNFSLDLATGQVTVTVKRQEASLWAA